MKTVQSARFSMHRSLTAARFGAVLCVACALSVFTGAAWAQTADSTAAQAPVRVGVQSEQWLQLQTSGQQASDLEQTLEGDVASRVYQRYLDSFTHPIPQHFPRESFSGDGGS